MLAAILSLFGCSANKPANGTSSQNNTPSLNILLDDFSYEYFDEYNSTKDYDKELEAASEEADSYLDIPIIGNYLNGSKGSDILREAADNSSNTINGYIDENIVQGISADCWLITSTENLSYTPKGAKIIHDAITEDDNGDLQIYFKGPNLTYTVTQKELKKENKKHTLLSIGDDDMLAIEIATRKFRQDLADGKINIDKNLPDYMYSYNDDSYDVLNFGETRQGYWLLAGITDSYVAHEKDELDYVFDKFESNPENSLLDVELKKDATVKDINGNKVCIRASHGYGVKNVDENTVTLICATNSNQEITLSKDTIYKLPLSDVIYCPVE